MYGLIRIFARAKKQKNMSGEIEHEGTVIGIDGHKVRVLIEQTSACAACHAKSACTASDKAEKVIDAENRDGSPCRVGERVQIKGDRSLGLYAVLIAFVIPLCIIIAAMFIASAFTDNEVITGLVGLCSTIPYLLLLLLLRKKFQSKFRFYIVKL